MPNIDFLTGLKIYSDFPWMPKLLENHTAEWAKPLNYGGLSFDANDFHVSSLLNSSYQNCSIDKGLEAGAVTALQNGFIFRFNYHAIDNIYTSMETTMPDQSFRLMSFQITDSGYTAPEGNYEWVHIIMQIKKEEYPVGLTPPMYRFAIKFTYELGNIFNTWGDDYYTAEEPLVLNTCYLEKYYVDTPGYYYPGVIYFGMGLVSVNDTPDGTPDGAKLCPYLFTQTIDSISKMGGGQDAPLTPINLPGTAQISPVGLDYDTLQFTQNWATVNAVMGYLTMWMLNMPRFNNLHGGSLTLETESPEVGPESEPGGGGGLFDGSSDPIDLPEMPEYGVSTVGFVNVYKTDLGGLQGLGRELFPPLQYSNPGSISANDVVSAIVNAANSFISVLANIPSFFEQQTASTLINYILDCHIIPVAPSLYGQEQIRVGNKVLSMTAPKASSDYVDVSCGSINIGEFYANFADYLTSAKLYLPFIGFVPMRPEWFQNATLAVDYRFNIIDGSFACYVRAGGDHVGGGSMTIVAQYAGVACMHIPITGATYASMVSGLVGAGSGMIAGAAAGNIATVATSAIAATQAHGDIASSNAYSSSAAFLSCRRPFLMIDRPVSSYARNYQHENGLPANIYARLGDVSGFVQMLTVHVDNISGATEKEKDEIKSLLGSGVIV